MSAPATAPIPEGTVLAERYRVKRVLGEGGMGAVYLAEHVHMRKDFAVKVLHKDMCENQEVVARFEREAIAAGHIEHPHVAAATDFGRLPDGAFFLVLEYVAGTMLRRVIDAGPLEPLRALRIARSVVAAVGAAHAKGIVHRDLKPENVMLVAKDGDPDFVKVLDFGIAKFDPTAVSRSPSKPESQQPLTRIGAVFGTPDYMAPEQALGETVDHRADLYAIGVMLHEMLSGERPFKGGTVTVLSQRLVRDAPHLPQDVLARVDPRVQPILSRLLEKTPSARAADANEVLASLDEVLAMPAPSPSSPAVSLVRVSAPGAQAIARTHVSAAAAHAPTRMAGGIAALPTQIAQRAVSAIAPSLAPRVTPPRVLVAVAALSLLLGLALVVVVVLVASSSGGAGPSAPAVARAGGDSASAFSFAVDPPQKAQQPPAPEKKQGGGRRGGFHFPWW